MHKLNLTKIIAEDSLRGIGENYNGLTPQQTVIGGNNIFDISDAMHMKCYRIGRVSIKNAFVLYDGSDIFYVYVNPNYTGYRKLFLRFIEKIPEDYHIDHILAKNLAGYYIYNYVLVCMLPGIVNREHGSIEKKKMQMDSTTIVPSLCCMDNRIFHKVLSRKSTARQTWEDIQEGYSPKATPNFGLTLKQKGLWNSAFGFYKSKIKLLSENKILTEIV